MDDMIAIGVAHYALLESLRPDITHPNRKIRAAKSVVTEIMADDCDCSEEHVDVYVWRRS